VTLGRFSIIPYTFQGKAGFVIRYDDPASSRPAWHRYWYAELDKARGWVDQFANVPPRSPML